MGLVSLAAGLLAVGAAVIGGLIGGTIPDQPEPGVSYIIWGLVAVAVVVITAGYLVGFAAQDDFPEDDDDNDDQVD